uniref:Gag-pol polyprotein n=1 Tax=Solanum tuberosum TaxID=4113 RepID=M1DBI2_SOLTU
MLSNELILNMRWKLTCSRVRVSKFQNEKLKGRSREKNRSRIEDDNSSHARFDGHGHPRFQQKISGKVSSKAPPRFNKERVFNPKSQGNGSGSLFPSCAMCGKRHEGKCLAYTNGCFGCGKSGHKVRDCPMLMAKGREGKQAPPSGSGTSAPKQDRFYAFHTRGDQ